MSIGGLQAHVNSKPLNERYRLLRKLSRPLAQAGFPAVYLFARPQVESRSAIEAPTVSLELDAEISLKGAQTGVGTQYVPQWIHMEPCD
jgi:hypothetical protein